MKRIGFYLRRGVFGLVFLAAVATAAPPTKIVAIGDVHGAYPQFVSILQRTGLIDQNLNWAGGQTTFVQMGDILDRGGESRRALDLMMKLEGQSTQQKGTVIPLLGNHEVMDMMGDLRYVSQGEYHAFATDQSEKVREEQYENYKKFVGESDVAISSPPIDRDQWMAEHPAGFFELRDAYGPKGYYGRWFRSHDAVVKVGDAIFLHGGLDPDLNYKNIDEINKRVHEELSLFDSLWKALSDERVIWPYMTLEEAIHQCQGEYQAAQSGRSRVSPLALQTTVRFLRDLPRWSIVSPQGPLWYRGLAEDPEAPLEGKLEAMLARLKAKYIVMGHTVISRTGITPRFDDHAFLIDTGMNPAFFHGRPSALVIENGSITAEYANGDQQALVKSPGIGQGQAAPSASQVADGKNEK
jgi:Calcineurin-like phosphoesterase